MLTYRHERRFKRQDLGSRMRVSVLYSPITSVIKGEAEDIVAEEDTAQQAGDVAGALTASGYVSTIVPVSSLGEIPAKLKESRCDVVFNLCETVAGSSAQEAAVVEVLEAAGFRYTGSPAAALSVALDKNFTKTRLQAFGVSTPRCWVFDSTSQLHGLPLRFPLIVKPLREDGSLGIHWDSVVDSAAGLVRKVQYIFDTYKQPALVEEYIDGREFNISVWGNRDLQTLPLAELNFDQFPEEKAKICSFEAKWVPDSAEYQGTTVICPAHVPEAVGLNLRDTAIQAYSAIGCQGYGRIDIRLGPDLVPYVIDVNANPCIAREAGFAIAASASGLSYESMVSRIVQLAYETDEDRAVSPRWSAR